MNRNDLRNFAAYCMMKGLFKDDLIFSDYELVDQYLKDSDIINIEANINLDKLEKDIDSILLKDSKGNFINHCKGCIDFNLCWSDDNYQIKCKKI